MKDLLQRLKGTGGRASSDTTPARLTLAAFGKHPGWDDHIQGLGVETEALAQLKQVLYVAGIGGQIDSGAWEKLELEKRFAGFEHTFLWLRPGHVLVGQLWSSTDGKGRGKYPMVLGIDGEGVSPGFMLRYLLAGLERLQEACKHTTSAQQVASDCRNGQEQLRAMLTQDPTKWYDEGPPIELRQRFLVHPQLGPDRLGFLRALHELKAAPALASGGRAAGASTVRSLRSSHLRLPLAADSPKDGLQLWSTLLRGVIPETVSLLLIARAGENWLDVLIGEPGPDDFFCLQASPKALPLATQIPYQLAPDLKERWQELEQQFLNVASSTSAAGSGSPKVASPSPVPSSFAPSAPASPVTAGSEKEFSASMPSPTPVQAQPTSRRTELPAGGRAAPSSPVSTSASPPAKKSSMLRLAGIGALVLIIVCLVVWFLTRSNKPSATAPANDGAPSAAQNHDQGQPASIATSTEQGYQAALAAAQAAQLKNDYTNAISQTELALKFKAGDPAATKLLGDLTQVAQAAWTSEQKYKSVSNGAALALMQMNYREATNQAALALATKPGDPVALKIMTDARQAIESTANQAQQQNYFAATNAAAQALAEGHFQEVSNQAGIALSIKPGDPFASQLLADARAFSQREASFEAATNAAGSALAQSKYREATNQAAIALAVFSNNPVALQIRARAEDGLALETARDYFARGEYAKAAAICQSHPDTESFNSLAANITTEKNALADASTRFATGDYTFADSLRTQNYQQKPPFAKLLSQADQEKGALDLLQALKQTNAWQQLTNRLADPTVAPLLNKKPFADLQTWAAAQSAATTQPKEQPRTADLDGRLEVLLVQFRILKASSPDLQTEAGRQARPIDGALANPDYYRSLVDRLEADYSKGGLLDQSSRKKYLAQLRDAINLR